MPNNTPTLAEEFGKLLTRQREEVLHRSRSSLADEAGLASNTLREVEVGDSNLTLRRVEQLADLYRLNVRLVPADGPLAAATPTPIARAH